ncbi:caspase family protein [Aetokthonos hydrillicola Thurmond2011]|jgi:WD40 repeat protein|uniref:Caspase family protein n=1 Tax=Aetokthonos hydrillicola Thurmond2011 TaxID=2712845 RepID=A0AAP5MD15_9CYAN|nr:caspase family protein [Aetokthonos hydrillicola]MBO3460731.1 hypothetical protein [Aetokthonos hydrillicola CCALA 1050]MBW4586411.1 caspase family protein [Aetokthonos hydrillicola CCALA 1050]MDR9899882.1 caspase family protein [Aetokthonos hydrillicola Thurmond2011]
MRKSSFNRNYAIIIGINKYQNGIRELETAVPDALKLAEIIQQQHRGLKPEYQAQNKYQVQLILNQRATLNNFQRLIQDFKKAQILFDKKNVTVTEDDRIFFYFAGHGIAKDALDSQDGPVGYLIPQDAKLDDDSTYLPMQDLHDALNALPCRHMLVILDCCFAGAFRWTSVQRDIEPKLKVYKERYDRFISDRAWQVITSAADDQKALDSLGYRGKVIDQNEIHSPFATALFDALRGGRSQKSADLNQDTIITATELYLYLRDKVEVLTENLFKPQTPGLYPLKKHEKGEFIFLLPGFDRDRLGDAPPLNLENNPYRGLQSYDEKDSHLFFGRQDLIEKLCNKAIDNNRRALTLIVGASGTGKSSLMKAGLLPCLRNSQEHQFKILDPMRPGESPLKALAQVGLSIAVSELAKDELALAKSIRAWSKIYPKTKLLLPIDQFEELITLCKSEKEREQFLKVIKNAIAQYPQKIHVVITLRLDFEAQFQNSVLKEFWNEDTRFVVPPMTQDEFREVIEKPASEKVVYFDPPTLVDELINEVVQMPGALPLLSFTLSELYLKYLGDRTRNNRALTKKDYEELGRVVGSLTQRANQEYDQLVALNPAYKDTVRRVMLRMISLQGGESTKRQVPKSELEYPDKEENERVQMVIRRFSDARLIVEGSNPQGQPYVEPAHDALVQGWNKLLMWKKQEEENIILQRRLTPAAEEWNSVKNQKQLSNYQANIQVVIDCLDRKLYKAEKLFDKVNDRVFKQWLRKKNQQNVSRGKPVEFLWSTNPYLDILNKKLHSDENWFNYIETEFVEQSVLQKRRNISWRWRIAIAVILGLSGLTLWALINLRQAKINQMLTHSESADADLRSNQLTLDPLINSVSAGESLKTQLLLKVPPPKEEEQTKVIRTLRKAVYTVKESNKIGGFPSGVRNIFWQKNGNDVKLLVVSTDNNGTIQMFNKQAKELAKLPGNQYLVEQIIFSPDGSKLAIGTNKGSILLWDWQTQKEAKLLQKKQCEDSCAITSLSFNPDGSQLVSVAQDGIARWWSLSNNGYKQFQIPQNKIVTAGFQSNNQLLLVTKTLDSKTVGVFNTSFPQLRKTIKSAVEVDKVILSATGKEIAIIYGGGRSALGAESYLWKWQENKNNLQRLLGRNIDVNFSRDGKQLAAAGFNDGTIHLFDSNGNKISELKGHKGQIASFNFRSDGELLATASADGTLRLWTLQQQQPTHLQKLPEKVNTLTFNHDGTVIATQAVDGSVHLLNGSGNLVEQFNLNFPVFKSLRFSPNNKQLATLSKNGTVGIIDLASQKYRELVEKYDPTSDLRFKPNIKPNRQQLLAVTGNDKKVYFLDVSSGRQNRAPFPYAKTIIINNIIWTSKDETLLVGLDQPSKAYKSIVQLDLKSGRQLQTIPDLGSETEFNSISANNDGSLAAFVQQGNTVSLWYMEGLKMGEIKVYNSKIKSVVLSPDSSTLATISEDGSANLWEIGKLDALLAKGCDRLQEYLQIQSNVNQRDRHFCDSHQNTTRTTP